MYTLSSIKYKEMQNSLWYNKVVPAQPEKKDQPLALRVPESLLNMLAEIAVIQDRPLGYVARELMVRGLALYRADGKLRDDAPARKAPVVATISGGKAETRAIARVSEADKEAVRRQFEKELVVPVHDDGIIGKRKQAGKRRTK
jgi:hypothetical protein